MKIEKAIEQSEHTLSAQPWINSFGHMFFTHLGVRWIALGVAAPNTAPTEALLKEARMLAELSR